MSDHKLRLRSEGWPADMPSLRQWQKRNPYTRKPKKK